LETETHLSGFIRILNITFQPISPLALGEILIVFLLAVGSALVSGSYVAFFKILPADLGTIENKATAKVNTLLKLLSDPEKLMASLLVINGVFKILICIGIILIVNTIISSLSFFGLLLIAFVISFLLLIIGEMGSKLYANTHPKKYVLTLTYPIYFLQKIFAPIAIVIYIIINALRKTFFNKSNISAHSLTNAMAIASDSHNEEEVILKGIVKFGGIYVREILKPRIDVVAVDFKMSLKQLLEIVVESGYSRIPVYKESFDNIRGILYVKDLLPFINEKDNFRWQTLIRPPYFVPETKKVKELLTEFQSNKIHMAVIVDEYGGTLGIVTLEDILEEIVGEISDESDEEEKNFTKINEFTYVFDGKTLLNDFYKIIQQESNIFDDIKGDADTLAGLILELKGAIPARGEQIFYKQFTFKIEEVDSRRIKQIRVIIKKGDD
jgi:gliding motility-associated protein GldE